MSILVRFAPADDVATQQYDETISRLQSDGGDFPPGGLEYHIAFMADGKLRVSEVWDSHEVRGVRPASHADPRRGWD